MMIKCIQYLDEIKKVLGKQAVKVLLGIRRVGKSTLNPQIQDELLKPFSKKSDNSFGNKLENRVIQSRITLF